MNARGLDEVRELSLAAEDEVVRIWTATAALALDEQAVADREAHTVLDRLAQIGVALAEHHQFEHLDVVVGTLARLFRAAADRKAPTALASPIADEVQATRWFDIATRVYVVGAVSVATEAFGAIRRLVLEQPDLRRQGRYWLREAVTALARLNRFNNKSLLGPISEYVSEHPVFSRRFRNNKDDVVRYLCQFDFLQCVVSVAESRDLHACYPNFGGFFKERTEPIIGDLIRGGKSRAVIPGVSDADLARIVVDLDSLADRQFFSFAAWHAGFWDDPAIPEFLAQHGGAAAKP